jgi:hypothetical protein
MTKEIRNPKSEWHTRAEVCFAGQVQPAPTWIRALAFGLLSDFGIRASAFIKH